MPENKWVTFEEVRWGDRIVSTSQLRVVNIGGNNNPVRVVPIDPEGEYSTIPSGRARMGQCDRIARVDMTPKQILVPLKGTVSTKDSITLIGTVNTQARVRDSEGSIERIAVNAQTEESLLIDSALSALREGILAYTWREIKTVNGVFLEDAEQRLAAILTRTQSCFVVDNLIISEEIQPENKEIALWLEKQEKDQLSRVTEKAQLAHAFETQTARTEFELGAEKVKMLHTFGIQAARTQFELEQERIKMGLEFEKAEKRMELESKITEAKHLALNAMTKILGTDAGQMAAFPEEVFAFKTKLAELEIAQRGKELQLEIAQRGKELQIYEEFLSVLGSRQSSLMEGEIRGLKATSIERFVSTLSGGKQSVIEGEGKIVDEKAVPGTEQGKDKKEGMK